LMLTPLWVHSSREIFCTVAFVNHFDIFPV
jgi:hypothetical protein